MKIVKRITVLDAADIDAESGFWAGMLGGTVRVEDEWHSIYVNGRQELDIQSAPDHVSPDWPNGTAQQVHMDLYIEDLNSAHEEAISLGATLLQAADVIDAGEGFQVYADPAGHPFCLCWG
jgi:hypothetical protein